MDFTLGCPVAIASSLHPNIQKRAIANNDRPLFLFKSVAIVTVAVRGAIALLV
ncbi:MAG: hypothetical protein AAGD25_37880 [Cyanobacteria bacterium P01_F01_bin.150]